MPLNILLVDDHRLIREGISQYLAGDETFKVVAEASNGIEALDELKEKKVDVALVDIRMPHMDGIELTKKIFSDYPDVKVIALTMLNDNLHIKKMMNAGALGYVLKNCSQSELKKAISTVSTRDTYYSPEVTETVMNAMMKKKGTSAIDMPLTEREKEVLKLIVEEQTNQEIADQLFISIRTVDAHKRNLLEKTGAKNLAGLVIYAINNGLVEDY